MRYPCLVLLISLLALKGFAQSLEGKWYMINRSGLIEMNITKDSLSRRELNLKFLPKTGHERIDAYPIKIVKLADKILMISKSNGDSSKYSTTVVIDYQGKKGFKMVWNGLDTSMREIDELIYLNKKDNRKLYGYSVFSEYYIDSLKQLKSIDSMTVEEFRRYAEIYVGKINLTRNEFAKYNTGYASATYNFQLITQSLFDLGFNPIQNTTTVDAIYKKYMKDPEVVSIFNTMNKE